MVQAHSEGGHSTRPTGTEEVTETKITMCVLSWHLSWCSHFFFLLEMTLEQFDFLIIVLPFWNYPHGCLQLGLFGHRVVTLQTQQDRLQKVSALSRGVLPSAGINLLVVNNTCLYFS